MTPQAFASELARLNTALSTGDDTAAQAAIYAMEWEVPGTAERMARSLLGHRPVVLTATRGDWGCAGCADNGQPHTCGK